MMFFLFLEGMQDLARSSVQPRVFEERFRRASLVWLPPNHLLNEIDEHFLCFTAGARNGRLEAEIIQG